jgi:hypothetical protein
MLVAVVTSVKALNEPPVMSAVRATDIDIDVVERRQR